MNMKFNFRASYNKKDYIFYVGVLGMTNIMNNFDTKAVRAGQKRTNEGEHSEALFLTSSYVFISAEQAASRFAGEDIGNVYSRYTNPTVRNFEDRLAALENAEQAVATSSGMAAILAAIMSFCSAGDHILVSRSVFGSTISLCEKYLKKFAISVDYPKLSDLNSWQSLVKPNTKLFFAETPSNPLAEIVDIKQLADIAHQHNALLVIDNCFCTPVLQQPLGLGADIVMHSATKYLDGQGRCLGGVLAGNKDLMQEIVGFLRTAGPTLSPFNAWIMLKGLETLPIRMRTQSANALNLANWLQNQSKVKHVYYTGLATHPQHELAKQQQNAFGAVLSFEVNGEKQDAFNFINATKLMSITTNLGDTKTTISHPASTSHGRLSDAERANAGINNNLIRISVGLEDIADLKQDFERGFNVLS